MAMEVGIQTTKGKARIDDFYCQHLHSGRHLISNISISVLILMGIFDLKWIVSDLAFWIYVLRILP